MIELLDFYADWCPPCQQMKPVIGELEKEFERKFNFKKINVDKEGEEAAKFKIMSVPTFVILKDGQEVGRKIGALSREVIKDWINQYL